MIRDTTRPGECTRFEAALILDIHPNTLRRWAESGKVPYRQKERGAARRYDRAALVAWARTRPDKVRAM